MNADELAREALVIELEAQRALGAADLALPPGSYTRSALPVRSLAGAFHGWFVPVVAHDRLVAFLRYSPQRLLRGTSSFVRQPRLADGCPLAADWLDATRIRGRAQVLGASGDEVGDAILSFDGAPDRLAWAVPLRRAGAAPRWVFVTGDAAWIGMD